VSILSKYSQNEIEELKTYGEVSKIYKVVSKNENCILKVNSLDYYENFLKEKWCIDEVLKIGINVPKVISVEKSVTESSILLEFKKGTNCFEIKHEEFRKKLFENLGKVARKISIIKPSENIGDLKNISEAKKWFYEDYIEYELAQTQNQEDYLELTTEQREKIIKALNLLKNFSFEFSLCHGDLSLKNCLYNKEQNSLVLLDFGSAETHVQDYFEIMLKWVELKYENSITEDYFLKFAEGFLGADFRKWLENNVEIIEAFALVYVLDKYRWAHDKSTRDWQEKYLTRLYRVLEVLK
jgi:fructosamine-3-kinase